MKLILFEENDFYKDRYKGECFNYIIFISKYFQFRWFKDFEEWFLYIHLGKKFWRFSSAGYLKGESK